MHRWQTGLALFIVAVAVTLGAPTMATAQAPSPDRETTLAIRSTSDSLVWIARNAPIFRSAEDARCLLNGVRAVFALSDGRVVVANNGGKQFCTFAPSGALSVVQGRGGSGPGEYQYLEFVSRFGADSLVVYDGGLRRLSITGPTGEFARSLPIVPPSDTMGGVVSVTGLPDRTIVIGFSDFTSGAPSPEAKSFTQTLVRYSSTGALLNTLGSHFASEHFIQSVAITQGGVAYWGRAFGRRASLVAGRGVLHVGDASSMSVQQVHADGRVGPRLSAGDTPKAVTRGDIDAYTARELSQVAPARREGEERRVREMPYPSTFPAYSGVVPSNTNELWFKPYSWNRDLALDARTWRVWDLDTRRQSNIELPTGFSALDVIQTRVCGVMRDDNDVERVICFALGRR